MVVKICPHCQARYVTTLHSGDFNHDCRVAQSDALSFEDVSKLTNYEDYAGSITYGPSFMWSAAENKLQGTRGGIEGGNVDDFTARGNRKSTHRTRYHIENIEDAGDPENGC